MWMHPINMKRLEFGIFSHLYLNLWVFRTYIEKFYRLSQLVGEEIRKPNTNYRTAISPEERLAIYFRYVI
jgi:hypothetical protein